MMRLVHRWRGWTLVLLIVWVLALVGPLTSPTAAQDDDPDPAAEIEALALQAHLQNMRQDNYTAWIGGDLGPAQWAPARTAVGETLDSWSLDGFLGDDDLSFEDLTRPTLLNFWASWCPPCRAEFPHLSEIAMHPDEYNFDVIFINTSDTPGDAREFLADYPQELVTVIDRSDRFATHASVEVLPTTILIDTDGTVLAVHIGSMSPAVSEFLNAVAGNPGVGSFDAAAYQDVEPGAILEPVDVDAAEVLSSGDQVTGTIDDDTTQVAYAFEGAAGDEVTVEMTAVDGALDCYVVLMTADEERLGENDDIERGVITDSTLTVTLPDDGTYVIVATRFLEAQGFSSGDYRLSLNIVAAESTAGEPPPQTGGGWTQRVGDGFIGYNTEIEGTVEGLNPAQLYAFEAQAGDVVTLTLTHEIGDAPLSIEVKDTHQNRLAVSEPSEGGFTALEDLALPEAGYYRVRVYRDRERTGGSMDFTLALTLVEGELPLNAPGAAPVPQGDTDIAYGGTVSGEITDTQYEQRWTFNGQAGDRVTIVMTRVIDEPGGLDGYLLLEGPDGSVIIEVDDAHGSVMPALDDFALPETGVYTIVATRFGFSSGFSTGSYTLSLNAEGGAAPPPEGATGLRWFKDDFPPDLHWLAYNGEADGVLDAENVNDWYIFQGREGDTLTIRLDAVDGDLDPLLILTDANGYELAANDDFEGAPNAAIADYVLPADGAYLIRATRYGFENGPSSGAYALVIETDAEPLEGGDLASLPALDYGDSASGDLSFDNPIDRYTFEGQAGDRITVSLALTGTLADVQPDVLPPLRLALVDPDGVVIEADFETQLYNVPLLVDGTYALEVELENLNDTGSYRLLLLGRAMPEVDAGAFEPAPDLDLEVLLIWSSDVDLNLGVATTEPDGFIPSDMPVNHDCANMVAMPVERIAVPEGEIAPGVYSIVVQYALNCGGQTEPVSFLLAIAQDGVVIDVIGGTLAREGDTYGTIIHMRP